MSQKKYGSAAKQQRKRPEGKGIQNQQEGTRLGRERIQGMIQGWNKKGWGRRTWTTPTTLLTEVLPTVMNGTADRSLPTRSAKKSVPGFA